MRAVRTAAVLCALLTACGGGREDADPQAPRSEPSPGSAPAAEEPEPDHAALGRIGVTIYFPAADEDGLVGEPREIFMTGSPVDRAKQIVSELLAGPTSETAIAAMPPGTRLRQVYVLDDGTAWADFSTEFAGGLGAGSDGEILTAYSVIDSLVLNIAEISRVGILVDGQPCSAPGLHLDLRRPLPADRKILISPPEAAPETPPAPTQDEGEPVPDEKAPADGARAPGIVL